MSKLIKATQYVPLDNLKQLDLSKRYESSVSDQELDAEHDKSEHESVYRKRMEEAEQTRMEILQDAKEFAERQVREASEEAERIMEEAKQQIEAWWQERRQQDEQLIEASKAEGFHQGYEEGRQQVELELKQQIDRMMSEAQSVLAEAQRNKEQIIQEAEPFVVALSCEIARKIVDRQLTVEPGFALDLIERNLARKKEQGTLTLCVSPSHYSFVHAAKEELSLVIDSQAELLIIPDSSVKDHGCVIRSSFGSVDARIDTQLTEIKKELLRISQHAEDQRMDDDHV
ncbi:FliH/SctL family protein [Paenibacillus physcomitrellae]|uniref:Flagellar assembly protein FliH n=1 Tax=Paenibacillus physcomitrellae TaxID=1619311 RepID=A0ABQ1GA93_9BACL|nr:FliH/SctL family protein [Paenibacillus physcomitrellae]GGA39765.1 flagellar assembly protein FliH [Paenibacillus physcomitrellae]